MSIVCAKSRMFRYGWYCGTTACALWACHAATWGGNITSNDLWNGNVAIAICITGAQVVISGGGIIG
jgi:hypothetical protein